MVVAKEPREGETREAVVNDVISVWEDEMDHVTFAH